MPLTSTKARNTPKKTGSQKITTYNAAACYNFLKLRPAFVLSTSNLLCNDIAEACGRQGRLDKNNMKKQTQKPLNHIPFICFLWILGFALFGGSYTTAMEAASPAVAYPIRDKADTTTIAAGLPVSDPCGLTDVWCEGEQYHPIEWIIRQVARQEGFEDEDLLVRIAKAESNMICSAKNPNSSATGIYQFIKSTWIGQRKKYNLNPDLGLRNDCYENILTAVLVMKDGGINNWDASKHIWNK
jgi:hypothetical protein